MTGAGVHGNGGADPTSASLLRRVQALDPGAWDRFVQLYAPLVYHWCRQMGLQEADAADVGQEVFRSVVGAIGAFRHDRAGATLRGWLRTITRNKVRDAARKGKVRPGDGVGGTTALDRLHELPDESDPSADSAADPDEPTILFRRALDLILTEFEPVTRAAFLRVVVEQQEPADVARELGVSLNAVYLAKSRIKKRLREEFADVLDLEPADPRPAPSPDGGSP